MWNFPTKNCTAGGGGRREIAFASTWHARERIAFGSVLGMLLDCEERDWQLFCEAMSSSAMQQEQLPCARSNYFLNHKTSCSTTSCRRGRCTRRNLLLRVCVHPLFHFTHQQLSQYTALISDRAEQKQRRHSQITSIVSFPVLFFSVDCLLTICILFP